jgi:hypothetical protein
MILNEERAAVGSPSSLSGEYLGKKSIDQDFKVSPTALTPLLGASPTTFWRPKPKPTLFLPASTLVGELATLAFLVVFRVLIKLFFWIDIFFTSSLSGSKIFNFRKHLRLVQERCQTGSGGGARWLR